MGKQADIIEDFQEVFRWAEWHDRLDCVFDMTEIIKILNKYGIKANIRFELEDFKDYNLTKAQYKLIKENQEMKVKIDGRK